MSADAPDYQVDPEALDEDQHPTAAWTEDLDPVTAARLKALIDEWAAC